MSEVAIQPGTAADIDAVMTVMDAAFDPAFGEAWSRAQCLGMLSLPDVWLLFARRRGTVQGFALGRLIVDDVEVLLLAVLPEARSRGIGGALIEGMAGLARARGAARLLLEMRANNPAVRLYDRAGFVPVGRRQAYYRGPAGDLYDALTLARPIA